MIRQIFEKKKRTVERIVISRSFISIGVLLFYSIVLLGEVNASEEIEIEIGNAELEDDYICWSPVEARARIKNPSGMPLNLNITTTEQNLATGSGELAFVNAPSGGIRHDVVNTSKEITIELPGDGEWRNFYVVGTQASSNDKDVHLVATNEAGTELLRYPLMVRVRKNAETLTDEERDRFLKAFKDASDKSSQFAKYWGIHQDGVSLAHEVAFLPWHRVFLINLERELQIEDPSVTLPYWEFDKPAPKLFREEFLGRVDVATGTLVQFSGTNPLDDWDLNDNRVSPLRRLRNGDLSVHPQINKDFMEQEAHGAMTAAIFGPYHGAAHVFIGGLIGDISRSPGDPLFFLLHNNVDRAWAAWQRLYDRIDKTQVSTYDLQGSHSPGNVRFGNFVEDTMWPWDNIERPTDPVTITTAPVVLPDNKGPGTGLNGKPKVGDTIDYLDMLGVGKSHSYCYDNIPYGVGLVDDFWTQ